VLENAYVGTVSRATAYYRLKQAVSIQEKEYIMNNITRLTCGIVAAVLLSAVMTTPVAAQDKKLDAEEAAKIGVEAYIYGYPLVTMEMTRRQLTNVEKPIQGVGAPMGQLVRMREYLTAANKQVTAPNADTLYVTGWIDVAKEPWVLSLPAAKDRYYLFPMLSAWTDVFQVPGTRTTGDGAQVYAITGPGWKGTLPEGMKEYKSQTALVWFIGRIYCTGSPEDYAAVHKLEDAISLVPLSSHGKAYTPPPGIVDPKIDMKKAPKDQVNALAAEVYFDLLAKLLKDNPPTEADAPIVAFAPGLPRLGQELPAPGRCLVNCCRAWPNSDLVKSAVA
jgi:hypothetical protein